MLFTGITQNVTILIKNKFNTKFVSELFILYYQASSVSTKVFATKGLKEEG